MTVAPSQVADSISLHCCSACGADRIALLHLTHHVLGFCNQRTPNGTLLNYYCDLRCIVYFYLFILFFVCSLICTYYVLCIYL